jgi:hypothetical protein
MQMFKSRTSWRTSSLIFLVIGTFIALPVNAACPNTSLGKCPPSPASSGYTFYSDCFCANGYVCGRQDCSYDSAPFSPYCGTFAYTPYVRQTCVPSTTTSLGCPCDGYC